MRAAFSLRVCFFALCFPAFIASVRADVRAGAARPLQSENGFVMGTHARCDEGGVNFVRLQNARPALWRAVSNEEANSRTLEWNVSPSDEQSSYLPEILSSQRALSPDGNYLAYVSSRSGLEAIYVVPFEEFGRQERAHRVVTLARNPAWLDDSTLLFQSVRPGRGGLFRVGVDMTSTPGGNASPAPQLLFSRGGESAVSPDGQTICLAAPAQSAPGANTQLFLLAADGSGARALPQTEGARRPCFAPDGKAIFFDAPTPRGDENKTIENKNPAWSTPERTSPERDVMRVLWTIPLLPAPPTAQLFSIRLAQNGAVEIIGTLYGSDPQTLEAELQLQPGDENQPPSSERGSLALRAAPIHNGVLALWTPPRPTPGEAATEPRDWTLRLSARDASGERVESTLAFSWPPAALMASAPVAEAPIENPSPNLFAETPAKIPAKIQESTRPEIAPPPANIPAPVRVAQNMSSLPAPALPPAPGAKTQLNPSPKTQPQKPPILKPPIAKPRPPSTPEPPKTQAKPPQPKPTSEKPAPKSPPQKPAPKVGGIPSQMKTGASTPVTVILRNTGSRSWSSTGDSPVRLIVRWISADSNTRQRWSVKWLRETVSPGRSTQVKFDLAAPPAPGRYILTYALVRLDERIYDGKTYKPPAPSASDHRWPGEFGAASFEIQVVS